MEKHIDTIKSIALTVLILLLSFIIGIYIQKIFTHSALAPLIFALACFLISHVTTGYAYGIAASLISTFAVNFAFRDGGGDGGLCLDIVELVIHGISPC